MDPAARPGRRAGMDRAPASGPAPGIAGVERRPGQTVPVIGIIIFAAIAVLVVVAFAAQISRRRRYESGEYDPDDV